MSISVFANIRINDHLRFERLKLSLKSFKNYNFKNWVINLRGSYRKEVGQYLYANIPNDKIDLTIQDTSGNWFADSQNIYKKILGKYVFIWNEDHINITNLKNFGEIVEEIYQNDVDQFRYTWFHNGFDLKTANLSGFSNGNKIIYDNYNFEKHVKKLEISKKLSIKNDTFIVSLCSIFKTTFFKKILFSNDPIIKRWKKNTPFDFEKCKYDIHWLPFKLAYPKKEFFASIDDNHGEDGYSLVDRGLIDKNISDMSKSYKKKKNITIQNIFLYPFRILKIIIREIINYTYARIVFLKNRND